MNNSEIIKKCQDAYRQNNEIIIYGAGLIGHFLYSVLQNKYGVETDFFCTSFNPEYVDKKTGKKVLNRESLRYHQQALVIVAIGVTFSVKTFEQINEYILSQGIPQENIILRTNNWFISETKPYISESGKLNVYTLSYHVTKLCNLKCKNCAQLLFGPVKRRAFPPEQIINDTDMIFKLIDHIDILKLIGGEVMMYKKLDELIDYLNKYADKIGLLELFTNGAVNPSDSLLESISNYSGDIQVTISDYGKLSIAKEKWIEFGNKSLEGEKPININILGYVSEGKNGYKGWIDCTETKDLCETEAELHNKHAGCEQRLDFVLEDSILGKCTSYHALNYALGKDLDKEECVYINDDISIEEKRKKIVALGSDDNYLEVCRYCVWGSSIREKLARMPAAEQMENFPE